MAFYGKFPKLCRYFLNFAYNKNFIFANIRPLKLWNNYRHIFIRTAKCLQKYKADPKLLFALSAGFSFKEHGVPDDKLQNAAATTKEFDPANERQQNWEVLVQEEDFRALRRKLDESGNLYEYKCAGTYYDISPRNFLDAQNNLTYRKEWDGNIISLELLAQNNEQELLRWISKFPYPLNSREYVYVRRTWVDYDERLIVVESIVIPEQIVPSTPNTSNVRVGTYSSRMIIRAHGDWNEHGLDYVLTYSDNPEANIPRYLYNWIVNQGGPYFLKQVHNAALQLELSDRELDSVLDKFPRPAPVEPEEETDNSAGSSPIDQENNRPEASSCRRKEAELIHGINKQKISVGTPLQV